MQDWFFRIRTLVDIRSAKLRKYIQRSLLIIGVLQAVGLACLISLVSLAGCGSDSSSPQTNPQP
jgi:hypothetical protein